MMLMSTELLEVVIGNGGLSCKKYSMKNGTKNICMLQNYCGGTRPGMRPSCTLIHILRLRLTQLMILCRKSF
ncbi:hypothetical protein ACHAW6_010982 [Cyclotella cf. meneghiniana]